MVGAGVLLLTALVVVGGLVSAPAQTSPALADGKADVHVPGPISAIQNAVRDDERTSRADEQRAALALTAAQSSVAERRVSAQEKQERAIAAQQKVLKQKKAEAARHKRIAAEKARKARIAAEKARISKLGYQPGITNPRSIARQILKNKYGYPSSEYACFNNIIMRESMWDIDATNASSGAYGIPQALPGSKMASVAADWRTNPATQIVWAIGYMNDRYGSPCGAWGFKSAHGWY